MGTLVVVTLRDARLVTLEDAPRSAGLDLADRAFTDEVSLELDMADADGAYTTRDDPNALKTIVFPHGAADAGGAR